MKTILLIGLITISLSGFGQVWENDSTELGIQLSDSAIIDSAFNQRYETKDLMYYGTSNYDYDTVYLYPKWLYGINDLMQQYIEYCYADSVWIQPYGNNPMSMIVEDGELVRTATIRKKVPHEYPTFEGFAEWLNDHGMRQRRLQHRTKIKRDETIN